MSPTLTASVVLVLTVVGYVMGRQRSLATTNNVPRILHSLPSYYGLYVAIWCGIPSLVLFAAWLIVQPHIIEGMVLASLPDSVTNLPPERLGLVLNDIRNLASGDIASSANDPAIQAAAAHYSNLRNTGNIALTVVVLALAVASAALALRRVTPKLRSRNIVESVLMVFLVISSTIAIFTTIGIVLSLLFEAIRFFHFVPWYDFLFGLEWSPQTAIRADQVGQSGSFGAVPIFVGTAVITIIAMFVSVPVGLFSAIYLAEFADSRVRATVKPVMEILAGVPTVVYGFFAALTVAPVIREFGQSLGLNVASESALAAGMVMGVMIIPFISSLSDDVINAVPQSLREGSYGLGATKAETIWKVILPAALPGIVGAFLLAISRAIGETMIVVMAAGLAANLTANPFEAVTTVTVQIVTLLVGDQEFDSAKTLAAFALGLVLFIFTLILNIVALRIVQKYREKYD
jgi:phosphate transport system permease protein